MALRHTYSLLTAVLMTGGCLLRPSDSLPQQPITVGQLLPDFTLAALQGGEVTLSSLRGLSSGPVGQRLVPRVPLPVR